MIYDVIVIGGGPAGMMAAGRAGERRARVLLIEKNNQLGSKLLATGHGRSNITNMLADRKETIDVYGKNFKFLFSAFNKFGVRDTISFFAELGLAVKEEDHGRVFPLSDKAGDAREALIKYLKKGNVDVKFGAEVKKVGATGDKIIKAILTDGQEVFAKNFIISTGGKSYPETGSTGSGYSWLRDLGHTIITPRPALTPIIVKEKVVKTLEGLSLKNISIGIYQNNKKIRSRIGEIIFTADGLSGPAAIDLSGQIGALLKARTFLKIDFKPEIEPANFEKKLQNDFHRAHNKMFKNYLVGLAPPKLLSAIIKLSGVSEQKQVSDITKIERQALVRALKEFTLEVKELKSFSKAMVTAGGVNVKEVDPRTMRSRLYQNLFLAGEILDLDGPTGGYNLQICWSTGYAAGNSAALLKNKMRKEKIIILDFDGVIADSFEIAFAINKISRPAITRERYRKLFDGNIYDAKLEETTVKEVDFFAEYSRRFKTLAINARVKSGIKKLSKSFRLFIISSTINSIINEYLERHGILDCFTEILGCDVDKSKIKKFNMVFEKYKILPVEAIFITDTSGDIREARAARVNFIVGILGGYQDRKSLEEAVPDAIAENFDDFWRIIQGK